MMKETAFVYLPAVSTVRTYVGQVLCEIEPQAP